MNDLISNLFRGSVSSVMNVILLFTLTKSIVSRKGTILVATFVFLINILSTIWFYLYGDLTTLSRFNVIIFVIIGISLKPVTKHSIMQWSFTFLTVINISMMIIILTFHLGKLFPEPKYANTILRLLFYILVIYIFQKYLLTLYHSIVSNWSIFSALVVSIFLNLSYFFFFTDDIQNTLMIYRWPLLLLVTLSVTAYGTVFFSMKKFMTIHALESENLKIQIETGRLYQETMKLEKYANYDTLTGLPNRRFFFETLGRVVAENKRTSTKVAILYIDLDAFKDINDTYGHEVGDGVLITVGNRLLQCIREKDFAARLGGDEFAIIVQELKDVNSAENLAKRINEVLQEPMGIDAIECNVSASIGIAIYPDAGKDSETVLRNADSAMYEIKKKEKGGVGIFKIT